MEHSVFTSLLEKYINGSITAEEKQHFLQLMDQPGSREVLDKALRDAMLSDQYLFDVPASETNHFIRKLTASLEQPARSYPAIPIYRRWAAAAAIILLAGAGLWYWSFHQSMPKNIVLTKTARPAHDATPGISGAILTLDDGSQVALDSTGNGIVANQNGSKVMLNNGQLAYEKSNASGKISYNTMRTPRGRQFRVVLPDGTKVWMNAASSIRYPTAFTGSERKVEIQGEAYLEVAQDASRPFIIAVAGGATIKVLGTSLNINAYPDESSINTTLVTGSIQVAADGDNGVTLVPGKEARLNKRSGKISVHPAAEEQVLAWKNGLFIFEKADIQTIMRQLSRWYDVDVDFNNITDKKFSGTIPRNVNVSTVFNILEATGNVHFIITDNKVTVQ
jgi:ferric-dicitrate binding protein FerR (iron transport regulator)